MREIKFRAWDIGKDKMFYLTGFNIPKEFNFIKLYQNNKSTIRILGTIKLMQFTGLKDKNGKEIYEGDIVKQKYEGDEIEEIGVVVWFCGGLKLQWKIVDKDDLIDSTSDIEDLERLEKHKQKVPEFEDSLEIFEVIGNKFENPELLK